MDYKYEIPKLNWKDCRKYVDTLLENVLDKDKDIEIIETNGNLASYIQYDIDYNLYDTKLKMDNNDIPMIYNLGKFLNIPIMVNPMMLWDSNNIFLKNKNNDIIHKIELVDNYDMLI